MDDFEREKRQKSGFSHAFRADWRIFAAHRAYKIAK
jgi:hypothetical protein